MTMIEPATRDPVSGTERRAVPDAWIAAALQRQGALCAKCPTKLAVDTAGRDWECAERDHIVAIALGGEHSPRNIQGLCKPCHKLKTATDMALIAKAKRLERDHNPETRRKSKTPLRSRKFAPADPLKARP